MAAATGLVAWVVLRAPATVPLPGCVFKAVTGWPCVTCGATRAILALLALDLPAAWRSNPLVILLTAGWSAYAVYGAGAVLGAWPRLAVELKSRECAALRAGALLAVAAAWTFLVVDGR
jgi:hypothetical protein